ncbi:hypothetical protein FRX31_033085 [Thalictrum thalictroides]|uniref:Uncharacterized protein n=1 Tax=Thalictrum thalictroides TaxID=46969 RepID=A0A7J6UY37_THATH|nr:hypothetical protein FRX31_033085 [Thalictrum thalictroides]
MNIDSHGQPTLKFKRFKAICDSESARKLSIASSVDEQEGIITSEANEASLTHSDPNRSPSEESLVNDELHFEKNVTNQVGYTVTQMLDMALNNSLQEPGLLYGGDASVPDRSGLAWMHDKVDICDLNPDVVSEHLEEASTTELSYGIDEIVPDSNDEGDIEDAKSDLKLNVAESKSLTYILDILTKDTPQPMELRNGGSACDFGIGNDGDTKKDISPQFAATHAYKYL